MKKALTIALSLVFTFGAFVFADTVYAGSYNWTDGYYDFLLEEIPNINLDKNDYTQFALYDINKDGIPELVLKNTSLDGNYKIYNYKDSKVNHERSLTASTFYLTDKDELVVSYGDVAGTTYVYYDAEKSLATSQQMFKSTRLKQISGDNWEWSYSYLRKFVSKEEFDNLMKEQLTNIALVYSDVNEANIYDEILIGAGFPGGTELANYKGEKTNNGNNVSLAITNGSTVNSKEGGVSTIYGLLMIDGVFATDVYPIYADGTTLVPVRAVSEGLNASVAWIADLKKINIQKSGISIEMYIDENYAIVNGERVTLSAAPTIIDGSTYVPIRFVSENLDCDVYFEGGNGDFLPIISIQQKKIESFNPVSDSEAVGKVKYLMKNINWTADRNIFARNYMDKNVSVKFEGEILNRFLVVSVDTKATQKMLVDKETGHVFSMYSYDNTFGIQPGIEAVIDAMLVTYSK